MDFNSATLSVWKFAGEIIDGPSAARNETCFNQVIAEKLRSSITA